MEFSQCHCLLRVSFCLALIYVESCVFVSWDFKVSFCIFSNLFSNYMLSFWNLLITSTCDFLSSSNFLSCSLKSPLCLLIQRFSSCLSRIFPSMSSVDYSVFRLLFNFLIFMTSVLLWLPNLKISSEWLDKNLLTFVSSNLCVFLLSSYCYWSFSFCCLWWRNSAPWFSNLI